MDTTLIFYPLDLSYRLINNKPEFWLFGKTSDKRSICVVDRTYRPYFLIKKGEEFLIDELVRVRIRTGEYIHYVVDIEKIRKDYMGEKIEFIKIYVNLFGAIRTISEAAKKKGLHVFEHDIRTTKKYLLDKNINFFSGYRVIGRKIKRDIKTDLVLEKISMEKTDAKEFEPVILAVNFITLYSFGRKNNSMAAFNLVSKDYNKLFSFLKKDVDSEYDLFIKFKEILEKIRPDIIVGYDSDKFLNHMNKRALFYGLSLNLGLDNSRVRYNKVLKRAKITGIVHLDLKKMINQTFLIVLKQKGYDINFLNSKLSTPPKLGCFVHDKKKLESIFEKSSSDTRVIYELAEEIWPELMNFSSFASNDVYDLSRNSTNSVIETLLMGTAKKENIVIFNKPERIEVSKRYEKKDDPVKKKANPGIYYNTNIIFLDEVYPDYIFKNNLSYETLDCKCCHGRKLAEIFSTCNTNKGLFVKLIEYINRDSVIFKFLKKCFFRYLNYPYARWYSQEVVDMLQDKISIDLIENIKKIIYWDQEIIVSKSAIKDVFVHENASALFLKNSKKYAILTDELIIKNIRKKYYAKFIYEAQTRIIRMILTQKNKIDILKYARECIRLIFEHTLSVSELVINMRLYKNVRDYETDSPLVSAARIMNKKGYVIGKGDEVSYVIVKGAKRLSRRVRLADEVVKKDYDSDYYIEKQLVPAIIPFLKLIGYDQIDLFQGKKQVRLDEFV
ncbi:hypothetical protein GF327_06215 [Candidatus Woesearchaeota archaeon]|nr:hypothetical protein [Candidatus Woesearchaeota archaeon]